MVKLTFAFALVAALDACSVKDPLYCSPETMCTAGLPYCDVNAEFPSSGGIRNTCIEQPYTVTVQVDGAGTVTSEPGGIACPGDCDQTYENSTVVTLHAAAAGGALFGGWTGDCTGFDPTCTLTADATHNVVARFGPPVKYHVDVAGLGHVVSDPPGISCPGTCDATFTPNTHVKLSATADTGSAFASWTGGCSGANPDCQTDATGDMTFSAKFAKQLSLSIVFIGGGLGHVMSTDGLIDCTTNCTKVVGEGATITLQQEGTGDDGFDGWSGPCTGEDPCAFTMTTGTAVSATFRSPWDRTISGPALNGIAADSGGALYLVGRKAAEGFVAKYDRAGNPVWSVTLGNLCGSATQPCSLGAIAIDKTADRFAVSGTITMTPSGSDLDWWVGQLLMADGTPTWSRTYSNAFGGIDTANGVDVDANGDIVSAGMETIATNDHRTLVRMYDPTGQLLWSKSASEVNSRATSVAVDSSNASHVVGYDDIGTNPDWLTAYAEGGAPGARAALPFVPRHVAIFPGARLVVAGQSGQQAAIALVDVTGNVAWMKTDSNAVTWLDACVDASRSLAYVVGTNPLGTVVDAYDVTGALVGTWQVLANYGSTIACDQNRHDITIAGRGGANAWIHHYYR